MDIRKTNRSIPHTLLKTAVMATVLALTACGTHNPLGKNKRANNAAGCRRQ